MTNYKEGKVGLTNNQLKKYDSATEKKTGTTLRITKKTSTMKNYHINYF